MKNNLINNNKKCVKPSAKRSYTTSTMCLLLLIIILMTTGCTFTKSGSADKGETAIKDQACETADIFAGIDDTSAKTPDTAAEEGDDVIDSSVQDDTNIEISDAQKVIEAAYCNVRDGYKNAVLTYVDNSEVGWDYYSDEPWSSEKERDELAQAAMMELYTLTGYNADECVYTTDGRSRFIFGKSADAIKKSTAFYSRDFGFILAGDSIPYIGFVNARRVHYSDVQQLDSPYHKAELKGHGAIPTWFLEHSGVYQGQEITGFEQIHSDDTVFTHNVLYFDGGFYIVVMDEGIESVAYVQGPYYDNGDYYNDSSRYDNDAAQAMSLFPGIEDEVYRKLLKEMLDSGEFPASEGIAYDGNPYENYYAVTDIDNDGKDELLLNFSNGSCMAGMVYYIYDYNRETGEVYSQHSGFPSMTFYENGYIKEDASHNHGRSNLDDFWPYLLYKYDPKTDRYESVAFVDAWQSTFYGEGDPDPNFPKEKDIDGDGIVYYDMSEDYYDPEWIVDNAEYEKWCEQYNKARVKEIEWSLIITEEDFLSLFD